MNLGAKLHAIEYGLTTKLRELEQQIERFKLAEKNGHTLNHSRSPPSKTTTTTLPLHPTPVKKQLQHLTQLVDQFRIENEKTLESSSTSTYEQEIQINTEGWKCHYLDLWTTSNLSSVPIALIQDYVTELFSASMVILEKTPTALGNVLTWQRSDGRSFRALFLPPTSTSPDPQTDLIYAIMHHDALTKCSVDLSRFFMPSAFIRKENRFLYLHCFDSYPNYPSRSRQNSLMDSLLYACESLLFTCQHFPHLSVTVALPQLSTTTTTVTDHVAPVLPTQAAASKVPSSPTTTMTSARIMTPTVASPAYPFLSAHEKQLLQWVETTTVPLSKDMTGFVGNVLNATLFSKKRGKDEKMYIKSLVQSLRKKGYLKHLRE